jgi:hypothetical protein
MRRARALRDLYEDFNVQFWNGRLPHAQRELTFGRDAHAIGINVRRVGSGAETTGLRCRAEHGFIMGLFRPPARDS